MDRFSLRHLRFDGIEETDELLMAIYGISNAGFLLKKIEPSLHWRGFGLRLGPTGRSGHEVENNALALCFSLLPSFRGLTDCFGVCGILLAHVVGLKNTQSGMR